VLLSGSSLLVADFDLTAMTATAGVKFESGSI
jgi:hypothetical protein